MIAVGGTFVVVAAATFLWLRRQADFREVGFSGTVEGLLAAALVGGIVCALLAGSRRPRAAIAVAALTVAFLAVGATIFVLPAFDPLLSPRQVAHLTPQQLRQSPHVYDFYAGAPWIYGLEFYFDREIPQWVPTDARPFWVWTTPQIGAGLLRQNPHWSIVLQDGPRGPWLLRFE